MIQRMRNINVIPKKLVTNYHCGFYVPATVFQSVDDADKICFLFFEKIMYRKKYLLFFINTCI